LVEGGDEPCKHLLDGQSLSKGDLSNALQYRTCPTKIACTDGHVTMSNLEVSEVYDGHPVLYTCTCSHSPAGGGEHIYNAIIKLFLFVQRGRDVSTTNEGVVVSRQEWNEYEQKNKTPEAVEIYQRQINATRLLTTAIADANAGASLLDLLKYAMLCPNTLPAFLSGLDTSTLYRTAPEYNRCMFMSPADFPFPPSTPLNERGWFNACVCATHITPLLLSHMVDKLMCTYQGQHKDDINTDPMKFIHDIACIRAVALHHPSMLKAAGEAHRAGINGLYLVDHL